MDGHPKKKTKQYRNNLYSDTRYAIIKHLEVEIPKLSGSVINLGSGNWNIPRKLLDMSKIKEYKTFDKKMYGDSKNVVDIYGDIQKMPAEWSNKWDNIICLEVIECIENPFVALSEMHRVLKPNGLVLLSAPFAYRFFGAGTGLPEKKNRVYDYWRITRDGLELLFKAFSKSSIVGFGGTGEHDRFGYFVVAKK